MLAVAARPIDNLLCRQRERSLRVALIAPGIPQSATGPSVVIKDLAERLADAGHKVTVLTVDLAAAGISQTPAINIGRGVALKIFALSSGPRKRIYYSREMKHWLECNIGGFDTVDIHGIWSSVAVHAADACVAAGVPYVLTLHGQMARWDWEKKYLLKRAFFLLFLRRVFRSAAALRFLSRGEAANSMVQPLNRAVIIPHWVEHLETNLALEREQSRETLAIPTGAPVVGFLGRINPQKGVIEIVEAFERLWQRRREAFLLMIGPFDNDYGSKVKTRIARLSSAQNIRILGAVYDERRFKLLSAASLFITLSQNEGLPLAALEAMAIGLPVVITEQSNLPEVAIYGAGAIVPTNPEMVAQTLHSMLADSAALHHMGEQAKKLVDEKFARETIIQQLINLYGRIATADLTRRPGRVGALCA